MKCSLVEQVTESKQLVEVSEKLTEQRKKIVQCVNSGRTRDDVKALIVIIRVLPDGSLSYRNQSIDLLCKSMDWFLYVSALRHERYIRIKNIQFLVFFKHLLKCLGKKLKRHNSLVHLQANSQPLQKVELEYYKTMKIDIHNGQHQKQSQRCSTRKGVFKNASACNFIKKETLTQMFSCQFFKSFHKTFFKEHFSSTVFCSINAFHFRPNDVMY